jgi:predicted metal-dependent hydrolase
MPFQEKIVQHPLLGEVCFRKMASSRVIRITVRAGKSVLVTLPLRAPFAEAEHMLHERTDWVLATSQRLQQRKEAAQTIFTPETEFGIYSRKVQLVPQPRDNVLVQVTPEVAFIYYPENRSVNEEAVQVAIRKAVEHACRVEAHEVLPQRIAQLAAACHLSYKKLLLKNTRTYWGMCSPDNSIVLNIHLMHLPRHLVDYVILHELAHTIHKNHGPKFWELLDRLANGQARAYSREMKKYSTRVY